MTYKVVMRALVGEADEQGRYAYLANEIMKVLGLYFIQDFFPSFKFLSVLTGQRSRLMKMRKEGDEILDKVIRERLEIRRKTSVNDDERKDILSVLLDLLEFGEVQSTTNVKAVIQVNYYSLCPFLSRHASFS